jgi:transcriptional regulator with XRE-family HTH domain
MISSKDVRFPKQLATLIRYLKTRMGITQRQIAEALIIDESEISRYRSGRAVPSAEQLREIANLCGWSKEDYEQLDKSRCDYVEEIGGVRVKSRGLYT